MIWFLKDWLILEVGLRLLFSLLSLLLGFGRVWVVVWSICVEWYNHHVPHWLKSKEVTQNHHVSSLVVIVSSASHAQMQTQFKVMKSRSDHSSGRFQVLDCRQSCRHGSRAGQEDIHLVCESGHMASHIKDRSSKTKITPSSGGTGDSSGIFISKKERMST